MVKQYFVNNCINIKQLAMKHRLDETTTGKVINGELIGERNTSGNTRAVFKVLESKVDNR